MPEWAAFAGFVGVVLLGLLVLARASADVLNADQDYPRTFSDRVVGADGERSPSGATASKPTRPGAMSAGTLLLNVFVSQGVFAALLVIGVWYASIPVAVLGLAPDAVTPLTVGVGVALGVALHAVNEVGSRLGERYGLGDSEALRRAMTPASASGWVVLLGLVLPLVAVFEELLFRGVLIGAFAAGFGVSPWLLAGGSSVAFALGHGAQGRIGIAVTGALGFVLAAAFVLTDSLVTVVIAHYLVNALEFAVRRD